MALTTEQLFWMLFGAAALSSAMTLIIVHVAFKYHIGPQIENKIDQRLKSSAQLLEESIRQRFVDVLSEKSGALRGHAKGFARTGISLLSGKRSSRDDDDNEAGF